MPNYGVFGFVTLTDETLEISGKDGWNKIALFIDDSSTADLTIQGATNVTVGEKTCSSITLGAGKSITLEDENGIDGITLTVPANCTVKLVVIKSKNNI